MPAARPAPQRQAAGRPEGLIFLLNTSSLARLQSLRGDADDSLQPAHTAHAPEPCSYDRFPYVRSMDLAHGEPDQGRGRKLRAHRAVQGSGRRHPPPTELHHRGLSHHSAIGRSGSRQRARLAARQAAATEERLSHTPPILGRAGAAREYPAALPPRRARAGNAFFRYCRQGVCPGDPGE